MTRAKFCDACFGLMATGQLSEDLKSCEHVGSLPSSSTESGTSEKWTPEMLAQLAAECDRVPDSDRAAEMLTEARAALAKSTPPNCAAPDNTLYYPLLFLCEAVEPVVKWLNEANEPPAPSPSGEAPRPHVCGARGFSPWLGDDCEACSKPRDTAPASVSQGSEAEPCDRYTCDRHDDHLVGECEGMPPVTGTFAEWFAANYPAGTEITDPAWHAPRILRAALRSPSPAQGDEEFERLLEELEQAARLNQIARDDERRFNLTSSQLNDARAALRTAWSRLQEENARVRRELERAIRYQITPLRDEVSRLRAEVERKDEALREACEIIELGDQRLLAGDGPAGGQPPELSLSEWRKLYVTLDNARKGETR